MSRSNARSPQECSTSHSLCHRNFHVSRRITLRTRHPQVSLQATSTSTSVTQSVFERLAENSSQSGGAGGTTTWDAFLRADEAWLRLRNMKEGAEAGPAPTFVTVSSQPLPQSTNTPLAAAPVSSPVPQPPEVWDVAVCGGTLGVFLAAALAQRGLRVAVIERGPLMGRQQEWNVSRKELKELCECGLLSESELEAVISMEFNPVRVGFKGGGEVWTRDVLNCGVSPDMLIQGMRHKLEARQGIVLDRTGLQGIEVHPDGVSLILTGSGPQAASTTLKARLVIDCMGHASPVVKQIRWGRKPDGVCIVVGTLASGFKDNTTADVIYTHTDLQPASAKASRLQLFWEAFPAGSGPTDRTTYMFTYMDASPWHPSMLDLFEEYWPLMSSYQGMASEELTFKRALFGMFPTFRDSPLKPAFDRVLQVGDASGIQSPLSFGGFGALTRHLRRITGAVADALEVDALDKHHLGLIHAYNPGLSSSWMMQRAMSVRQTDKPPEDLINRMLGGNFQAMERLGDPVMKPFLQDVIQLGPLLSTMGQQMVSDPRTVPQLIMHVGPGPLLDWMKHVGALGLYTGLHYTIRGPLLGLAGTKTLKPKQQYALRRYVEALEFGAGLDYKL